MGSFSLCFFDSFLFLSEQVQKLRGIKTICRKKSVLTDNSLLKFCKLGAYILAFFQFQINFGFTRQLTPVVDS